MKPKHIHQNTNSIDVLTDKVIIGTQVNIDDISKQRHFLRFRNSVTIKTNFAYAMIRCANIKPGDLVCDPFCGSGTILLETLDDYRNTREEVQMGLKIMLLLRDLEKMCDQISLLRCKKLP